MCGCPRAPWRAFVTRRRRGPPSTFVAFRCAGLAVVRVGSSGNAPYCRIAWVAAAGVGQGGAKYMSLLGHAAAAAAWRQPGHAVPRDALGVRRMRSPARSRRSSRLTNASGVCCTRCGAQGGREHSGDWIPETRLPAAAAVRARTVPRGGRARITRRAPGACAAGATARCSGLGCTLQSKERCGGCGARGAVPRRRRAHSSRRLPPQAEDFARRRAPYDAARGVCVGVVLEARGRRAHAVRA